jgi:molecular chaperone DnaK (HSP70)
MVVDAGGGTVDVTVHTCKSVGGSVVLAEAVHSDAKMCGSVMVDEAFK